MLNSVDPVAGDEAIDLAKFIGELGGHAGIGLDRASWLPVALKMPPSSTGTCSKRAPVRCSIPGSRRQLDRH